MLLAAILLLSFGEELLARFVPKYLEVLGAGAWGVAAYGTLKELLDAVYQYPGGWLTDRLGRCSALVVFTLLAAGGYALCHQSQDPVHRGLSRRRRRGRPLRVLGPGRHRAGVREPSGGGPP